MKSIASFTIGSDYFFLGLTGFRPKDHDTLHIMDKWKLESNICRLKIGCRDAVLCRNMTKEEFVKDVFASNVPMKAGKFLVKEFNDYIGFSIEDLVSIAYIFDNIDPKHSYEKMICGFYLDNGSFMLTDEQRLEAFEEYKNAREK